MRLYNGCPDDELQAVWDAQDNCKAKLKSIGCKAIYFPVEGKYMVFSGYNEQGYCCDYSQSKEVTGFGSLHEVTNEAIYLTEANLR